MNTEVPHSDMAMADKPELEDPPPFLKSAVWEHCGFPVNYSDDGASSMSIELAPSFENGITRMGISVVQEKYEYSKV